MWCGVQCDVKVGWSGVLCDVVGWNVVGWSGI